MERREHLKERRVRIADVAARAGVSTATVSRVINDRPHVTEAVRARVEQAIRETAYVPHESARALASKRNRRIGAVVPTLTSATFAAGVEALQKRLGLAGYTLAVSSSQYDSALEAEQAQNLITAGIDGLVLVGHSHPEELYATLRSQGIPFVCTYVNRAPKGGGAVGFDNHAAGREVAQFLIDLGHRRIGMIAALTTGNDRATDRLEGVREALRKAGLSLPADTLIESHYSMLDGRMAMRALLEAEELPTAIVCANDAVAFGALAELTSRQYSIPQDMSLISFGDMDFASLLDPPLTTLRIPFTEIGGRAADYLLARIEGRPIQSVTLVETSIVLRRSATHPQQSRPLRE